MTLVEGEYSQMGENIKVRKAGYSQCSSAAIYALMAKFPVNSKCNENHPNILMAASDDPGELMSLPVSLRVHMPSPLFTHEKTYELQVIEMQLCQN